MQNGGDDMDEPHPGALNALSYDAMLHIPCVGPLGATAPPTSPHTVPYRAH